MARYTMEDLLGAAEEAGYGVSKRLVVDWVSQGLLDQPERKGLGRGKGTTATWPEPQRDLFLTILAKRQTVHQVALLCNVPVALWLYEGDSFVPLRQVKRALATWSGLSTSMSWATAQRTARHLLNDLGHPEARLKDQKAFVDAATGMFYRDAFDETALLPLLRTVFDPKQRGLARTYGGLEITPEAYLELMQARWTAVRSLDTIDNSFFQWARYANLMARKQHQVRLAHLGVTLGEPVPSAMLNDACRDLVTLLGLGLHMPVGDRDPSLHNPSTWKNAQLQSTVQSRETGAGFEVGVTVRLPREAPER